MNEIPCVGWAIGILMSAVSAPPERKSWLILSVTYKVRTTIQWPPISILAALCKLEFGGPRPPRISINADLYYDPLTKCVEAMTVRPSVYLSCPSRARHVRRVDNCESQPRHFSLGGERRWSADPILAAASTSIGGAAFGGQQKAIFSA